jgi:hypothetical protein
MLKNKPDINEHYRISNQSIVNFRFGFKFNLIIEPFRVIMHVLDKSEQLQALNNVYDHLENGGIFIFDTFVPDLNQLLHGLDHVADFKGEYQAGKHLKRIASFRSLLHALWHSPSTVKQMTHPECNS